MKEQERGTAYEVWGLTLLIRLREDLDHHNENGIRTMADRLLNQGTVKNIVFDFSGVDFMDSSGIGVLMGRFKKARLAGGQTAIAAVPPGLQRILKFSGVCKSIPQFLEVEDAINAFQS